jgi:hypothetical protein
MTSFDQKIGGTMFTARVVSLIYILILAFGCGHRQKERERDDISEAQEIRDKSCATFDINKTPRCDRLTFAAIVAAYCPEKRSIAAYYRDGMWHRDLKACYPNESKSECSRDSYLSVIHYALEKKKPSILEQMHDDLAPRNWKCGPGPSGVTSVFAFKNLIANAADSLLVVSGSDGAALDSVLENFRGHLLAMYLWADVKAGNAQTMVDQYLVNRLRRELPESPLYEALYQRFHRQEYDRALTLLAEMDDASDWWGSAPNAAYIAATVAIMEGR